jgi:carboxypeptidase C (cathepsin A)
MQKKKPTVVDLKDANVVVIAPAPASVELPKDVADIIRKSAKGDQGGDGAPADADAGAKDGAAKDDTETTVTEHTVTIGGHPVAYTATAGTMALKEEDGTTKAKIFFTAYVRKDVADPGARPITFTFNGGPGSSSVWLHLGAFGPRRVAMPDDASTPAPPYTVIDNIHSILDVTDLVFIDPVSTGYSRAAQGEDPKQYHGVTRDVESVGAFIRLYTSRHGRWASPKYLAGESYGTTRAANLVNHLQERRGMYFNGVLLISTVLHFQTILFGLDNDLPHILYLPAYTATAWYHGRLGADLQGDGSPAALRAALDASEAFALGEYAGALLRGNRLPAADRDRIAAELARLTGLSAEFVRRCSLRIHLGRFVKELRREEERTVGRLDSRYTGIDRDTAGESFEYDPSYAAILGAYSGAMNHYLHAELGYTSDLPYEILTDVHPWDYDLAKNRYLDVAEPLRQAMTKNPHLRVFAANGYYDMATPYFGTEHTFSHLGLDPALAGNVTMGYYPAGHMMYVHEPSLAALKADLAAFYGGEGGG